MLLNYGVGEDSWESLRVQGDPTSPSKRKSVLNIHWKDWCWSWNSNTLPTWCEELPHLKRPGCWKRLRAGGEGDDRGWDGWMASPIQWTWIWVNSNIWWWTGRPGVLQSMGSQRVGHDLSDWTELAKKINMLSRPVCQVLLWIRDGEKVRTEVDVFLEFSLAFAMIWWMLAIWSLVPLPLLNSEHLEVHGSHTVEASLWEFWALFC